MKIFQRWKEFVIGKSHDLSDRRLFQNISLIALFAWVGFGSDAISSACYGPDEAFRVLADYPFLAGFLAIAAVITVSVISASYANIIKLFPSGGGGYVVASKLISPFAGVVSGSALLLDYCLTIAMSIAAGIDAVFSLLPPEFAVYKVYCALFFIGVMAILNLRGVKESVMAIMPVFFLFLLTHLALIIYGIYFHLGDFGTLTTKIRSDVLFAKSNFGTIGMLLLLGKAYSMSAGTYTGLEAISNSISVLREPREHTARKAMFYLALSLAILVAGLFLGYMLYDIKPVEGKTMNAVFIEAVLQGISPKAGGILLFIILLSETAILFIGAQTGFVDGPRVLSSMAIDRWFPSKFALLSDRLVIQNGILLMSFGAALMVIVTGSSIRSLVVLYSITVFITFFLSQLGMVRYALRKDTPNRKRMLLVNGIALLLTASLLISLVYFHFLSGGWAALLALAIIVGIAYIIKGHYKRTAYILQRLNSLVESVEMPAGIGTVASREDTKVNYDKDGKTAVFFVNGFNGLGLHTLFSVTRLFGPVFKNYVFVQIGLLDAGNFKGAAELEALKKHIKEETQKYVEYIIKQGYYAESFTALDTDIVDAVAALSEQIKKKFPNAVYFGGQLVFPYESILTRWLHNYVIFAIQRYCYQQGMPFLILPIRV
jgi:amino acid transporter